MDRIKFPPRGECIYCGSKENLTDEHIVPYGLGGNAILPEASCEHCRSITHEIETLVLRGELWAARILMGLQSRSKHADAPRSYRIQIVRRGKVRDYQLAPEYYPVMLNFPRFPRPGVFHSIEPVTEIPWIMVDSVQVGPSPTEVAIRLRAEEIRFPERKAPVAFARMIGKIAYSLAAATGELDRLQSPSPALPAILGIEPTIYHWVGCLDEPNVAHKGTLHEVNFVDDSLNGYLISEVQIFRNTESPRYIVVLGTLKEAEKPPAIRKY